MWRFIAPNLEGPFAPAASGALPLSFSGQAIHAALASAQPITVFDRFNPIHGHHRLVRMVEILVVPVPGRRVPGGFKENCIIAIANLIRSQLKSVHVNVMDRSFLVLPRFATHHEFPVGDQNKLVDQIRFSHPACDLHGVQYFRVFCQSTNPSGWSAKGGFKFRSQ